MIVIKLKAVSVILRPNNIFSKNLSFEILVTDVFITIKIIETIDGIERKVDETKIFGLTGRP